MPWGQRPRSVAGRIPVASIDYIEDHFFSPAMRTLQEYGAVRRTVGTEADFQAYIFGFAGCAGNLEMLNEFRLDVAVPADPLFTRFHSSRHSGRILLIAPKWNPLFRMQFDELNGAIRGLRYLFRFRPRQTVPGARHCDELVFHSCAGKFGIHVPRK